MDKIKCPKCGVYNLPSNDVCTDCGSHLHALTPAAVKTNDNAPTVLDREKHIKQLFIFVATLVVCSVIFYNVGTGLEYNHIRDGLDSEISNKQSTISAIKQFEAIQAALNAQTSSAQQQLQSLNSQVSSAQAQLNVINNALKPNGSPVKLPAGNFTVGKDIPVGRYSVTGSSNFIVDTSGGSGKVNTILGGNYGVPSYVCQLNAGDIIQAEGPDTYTPVS